MPGKKRRKATSIAERKAIAIAEHHPNQLYARNKGLLKMTRSQMHEMASVPEKGLPEKKKKKRKESMAEYVRRRNAGN